MSAKVQNKVSTPKVNTPFELFDRVLGKHIALAQKEAFELARGIQAATFEIIADSVSHAPEGKTYFQFCPIEDETFYIFLTFFPEISPKEDEDTFKIIRLCFGVDFFQQWDYKILQQKQPFKFDHSAEQIITLPPCCFEPISRLIPNRENVHDFSSVLERKESAIFLLRISLDAYLNSNEADKMPACSFLSNSNEREKVMEAYQVIMDNLETPKTIRELSRMVGMNECYLKKGFKVTFGKTIHEFQQFQRIDKAKKLLKEGKYSINEVAFKMGFGSASHFSSSFKKISGMRPCELLG